MVKKSVSDLSNFGSLILRISKYFTNISIWEKHVKTFPRKRALGEAKFNYQKTSSSHTAHPKRYIYRCLGDIHFRETRNTDPLNYTKKKQNGHLGVTAKTVKCKIVIITICF